MVNILVAEARKDAVFGAIAIACLKQVEGQESKRLALIDKYLCFYQGLPIIVKADQ